MFAPLIVVLAVIGIVYGALVAMVQQDVKKLVAYSSVSHMNCAEASGNIGSEKRMKP